MQYTPEMIERFGLVPYAVYGGIVHSFKCPQATGDKVYDASLLDAIFAAAMTKFASCDTPATADQQKPVSQA